MVTEKAQLRPSLCDELWDSCMVTLFNKLKPCPSTSQEPTTDAGLYRTHPLPARHRDIRSSPIPNKGGSPQAGRERFFSWC